MVHLRSGRRTAADAFNKNGNTYDFTTSHNEVHSQPCSDQSSKLPNISSLSSASSLSSLGQIDKEEHSTLNAALSKKKLDCEEYADKRQMTPLQEKVNAITILPSALMCLHYVLSGQWVDADTIEASRKTLEESASSPFYASEAASGCIRSDLFPNLPSLPPPTILAIALGIILHCPCSFLYHWSYAADPSVTDKFGHWSRRLDHSAIHLCSALWSYGISGSLAYFAINVAYNIDCIRCHLEPIVRPRRNQVRIMLSMILYTAPLLTANIHGVDGVEVFRKIWSIFAIAIWLFVAYPLRGWSHAAFHVVMVAAPPLLLESAAKMEAGGGWMETAARCAVQSGMRQSFR